MGLANYVYPTATHTRFEHSIGTVHTVSLLFDNLYDSSRSARTWISSLFTELHKRYDLVVSPESYRDVLRRIVRLAALLHDIGHLPRSHTFEFGLENVIVRSVREIKEKKARGENWTQEKKEVACLYREETRKPAIHELIGHRIITEHYGKRIREEFSGARVDQLIVDIFELKEVKRWSEELYKVLLPLSELLAGQLDSDRIDYVMRDAANAGSKSGQFDLDMVVKNATIAEKDGLYHLCYRKKALSAVNGFFLFRYNLFVDIYHHAVISLYDAIHAVLIEIMLNDPAYRDKRKGLIQRLCRGDLHATDGEKSEEDFIDVHAPLNDTTWETAMRTYIANLELENWRQRIQEVSGREGSFTTAHAHITDPTLLLKALDDRRYQPISIWKDYSTFRTYLIDPIIELAKQQDIRILLQEGFSGIVDAFRRKIKELVSGADEETKESVENFFEEEENVLKHMEEFFKSNRFHQRMTLYIIENVIFKKAFSFAERSQGGEQFYIHDIVEALDKFTADREYTIRNVFVSTKKPILYKEVYIDVGDGELEELTDLSPFFDNIKDQSQDRPLFYLYVQTDISRREQLKQDIPEIRELVKGVVLDFLKRRQDGGESIIQMLLTYTEDIPVPRDGGP